MGGWLDTAFLAGHSSDMRLVHRGTARKAVSSHRTPKYRGSLLFRLLVATSCDGLDDAGVDGGDQVDCGIQIFFRHSGIQRPLDAGVASRLAAAAQGDSQADEHLLALG